MTKREESVDTRILAADTLAYLIETSGSLQRVAAISNHLIVSIASFLSWRGGACAAGIDDHTSDVPPSSLSGLLAAAATASSSAGGSSMSLASAGSGGSRPGSALHMRSSSSAAANPYLESCLLTLTREMRRSAFRVFAALGANDEDIRKRVMETDNLMPCLVEALEDTEQPKLQMAAVGCLHSLSR